MNKQYLFNSNLLRIHDLAPPEMDFTSSLTPTNTILKLKNKYSNSLYENDQIPLNDFPLLPQRYTGKIAEGFGWKCVYQMPYHRYLDEGDFVFKCIQEPHTEMSVFVDRLNNYKTYYPPSKKD